MALTQSTVKQRVFGATNKTTANIGFSHGFCETAPALGGTSYAGFRIPAGPGQVYPHRHIANQLQSASGRAVRT